MVLTCKVEMLIKDGPPVNGVGPGQIKSRKTMSDHAYDELENVR